MTPNPPISAEALLNMYVAYEMVCPVNLKFLWDKCDEELRKEDEEWDALRLREEGR
jgi:hypothetical protein